jgi:hypothetical protein
LHILNAAATLLGWYLIGVLLVIWSFDDRLDYRSGVLSMRFQIIGGSTIINAVCTAVAQCKKYSLSKIKKIV